MALLSPRPHKNRRRFLKVAAGGLALGAVAAGNGFWYEPRTLSITRKGVEVANLPPALKGLRCGVIGDLHFRPGTDDHVVAECVERANAEDLDLIFIVGDYVEGRDTHGIPPMMEILKGIRAKHGVYAVMGNHDGWSAPMTTVRRPFIQAGIEFLINQNTLIDINGDKLAIAGTDFIWEGKPDLSKTFGGIASELPVIAMVHEPDFFDEVVNVRPGVLQLSGHTHGGQCRVPFRSKPPVTVKWGKKYVYGEYAAADSKLFVTRGLGTTGIRVRFACRPELAVLTLS